MTFERAWILLLLLSPAIWLFREWSRSARRRALALKAATLSALLVALSEPVLRYSETKVAVVALVDTSASVTAQDLARASEVVSSLDRARGRNLIQVIPFARTTRDAAPGERLGNSSWRFVHTAGDKGRGTDIEGALRDAVAALPPGLVPRAVLLSDGNENQGSMARAVWQAQQLGIPVDTVPLSGHERPKLHLESVSVPAVAFTGERFPIDLVVTSPADASGTVEISAEGKSIGSSAVAIQAGGNHLLAHASLTASGALSLSGALRAPDLGEAHFDQAMTLRRPRVLFLSQDPAGTETHLMQTLTAAQFEVQRSADPSRENLKDFQVVILNNWDLESIAASRKEELEKFVKQGGGLLVIGGEHNVYPQNKKFEDALDRTLPAKLAPPRSPEGTCVILIIDKSSSMEGKKMELARMAAIGVVDNLRPVDLVGVLIFDNSFQWAVPVRRAEDKSLIKRLVAGITPDGGTQIAPALSEAFRKIQPVNATYKHIVLLTDGISEEGDSMDLSKEAARQHVTISTVGLGQDVNRSYLEKVASFAGGKSYFLSDPQGLEQILLHDVLEHTGSTAVEKSLHAAVMKQAEILEGVDVPSAPALKGYVKFIAKPTAETILSIDKTDPLLTRWQYGLGRAAVFASDAKSRWADAWVSWKGFDRFWSNLFRDLLPHLQSGEASAEYDSANGDLVVDFRLGRGAEEPETIPAIFVFGPDGFERPIEIRKVAGGAYHGRVPIGQHQGLFRVRPLAESKAFPEVGFYRQEEELNEYGSNELLLRQIADFTGGHFRPSARQVFDSGGRSIPSTMRLWPGLVALAILLNVIELILRKWRGVLRRPAA